MCNALSKMLKHQLQETDDESGMRFSPLGDNCEDAVEAAIVAKYGGDGRSPDDAITAFLNAATEIIDGNPGVDGNTVSLKAKLDALKTAVGEETYQGLLANPAIEQIAFDAWADADAARANANLKAVAALLNNAVTPSAIACYLGNF